MKESPNPGPISRHSLGHLMNVHLLIDYYKTYRIREGDEFRDALQLQCWRVVGDVMLKGGDSASGGLHCERKKKANNSALTKLNI